MLKVSIGNDRFTFYHVTDRSFVYTCTPVFFTDKVVIVWQDRDGTLNGDSVDRVEMFNLINKGINKVIEILK